MGEEVKGAVAPDALGRTWGPSGIAYIYGAVPRNGVEKVTVTVTNYDGDEKLVAVTLLGDVTGEIHADGCQECVACIEKCEYKSFVYSQCPDLIRRNNTLTVKVCVPCEKFFISLLFENTNGLPANTLETYIKEKDDMLKIENVDIKFECHCTCC